MLKKYDELKKNREQGFTLIELLVVIVIIGVLTAIAIPVFFNQQKTASVASVKNDLRNTAIAMQTEATKNQGRYSPRLPSDVSISEGNNVYLSYSSSSTNLASGIDGTGLGANLGRTNGFYGLNSETGRVVRDKPGQGTITYTADSFGGPYWDYVPTDSDNVPAGTTVTVSAKVESNRDMCLRNSLEQKMSGGPQTTITLGNTCLIAGEPTYVSYVVTTNRTTDFLTFTLYGHRLVGDVFSFSDPIIVLGDTISENINISPNQKFCVEGYSDAAPDEIWSFNILTSGLKEGRC